MMAWGFISLTLSLHSWNASEARSAILPGTFPFRDAAFIPWKGNAPEDQLSLGATILMLGMIRLKMTNAAR